MCLALATAYHPLAKDDPSRGNQRSRYYPTSACKSGDDCGIRHGLPHLGSVTTTLDRSLLNLGAYAAVLHWSWRRDSNPEPAVTRHLRRVYGDHSRSTWAGQIKCSV
jgi:hypothetical protein